MYRDRPNLEYELPELMKYQSDICLACNSKFKEDNGISIRYRKIEERFCDGGRYGFLLLKKYKEFRPHIHQKCLDCRAEYILATYRKILL